MRFRATVWTLSAMGAAVEGDAALRRAVVEREAETESEFKALVTDDFTHVPDDEVHFGPVSVVTRS